MKIIQQGAEAVISLDNNQIIKNRIKKSYRLKILDESLRKKRTKSEARIIEKLNNTINVPKIISTDKNQIIMEYINGKKLSDNLESLNYKEISKQIGQILTKIHELGIIHGDLTTSNMILKTIKKKSSKKEPCCLYLIDFGLGFHSHKIEDKAVDLHLLQQALNAKHFKIADQCFDIIIKNYKPTNYPLIIERIKVIESRGRYKGKKNKKYDKTPKKL